MKCLPEAKLGEARGLVLHDWHAEVLALRAFNRFLLQDCELLAGGGEGSGILRTRREDERAGDGDDWHEQPFILNDGITFFMYCSEAPCRTPLPC
jgi:tRNA-specific adenosine deaminase 1